MYHKTFSAGLILSTILSCSSHQNNSAVSFNITDNVKDQLESKELAYITVGGGVPALTAVDLKGYECSSEDIRVSLSGGFVYVEADARAVQSWEDDTAQCDVRTDGAGRLAINIDVNR